MPDKQTSSPTESPKPPEPRGLGEHVRGLASEYAHEQGWGLNEDERRASPAGQQPTDGGTDYDYGAQDFGDSPTNTGSARVTPAVVDKILKD